MRHGAQWGWVWGREASGRHHVACASKGAELLDGMNNQDSHHVELPQTAACRCCSLSTNMTLSACSRYGWLTTGLAGWLITNKHLSWHAQCTHLFATDNMLVMHIGATSGHTQAVYTDWIRDVQDRRKASMHTLLVQIWSRNWITLL